VEHPLDLAALVLRLTLRRPDVVHVQWLPLGPIDRMAWRAYRGPKVFTAHNAVAKPGVGPEDASVARLFDAVVVHSAAGAGALRGDGRIVRIPHPALAGYAQVTPIVPAGVPEGAAVAAFVGAIRPYKGLGVLLDAWPEVRRQVPGATLVVCGRAFGDERSATRAAAMDGVVAELGYASPATFAGTIVRAGCVVLPYLGIDSSGVLLAALALGTPAVVSDLGGLREVIEETGAGMVVAPGDPAALASAVAGLLRDPVRRAAMAAAARAAADGPYAPGRAAALHEALYSSLGPVSPPRS
jgi:glycosyltransferase involved in cell wall biosynthesis